MHLLGCRSKRIRTHVPRSERDGHRKVAKIVRSAWRTKAQAPQRYRGVGCGWRGRGRRDKLASTCADRWYASRRCG